MADSTFQIEHIANGCWRVSRRDNGYIIGDYSTREAAVRYGVNDEDVEPAPQGPISMSRAIAREIPAV